MQRGSREELLFRVTHNQLVADMADNTLGSGDPVNLEFMNQGREFWEWSGMESRSKILRDKRGKMHMTRSSEGDHA
jgi:hypothetical protein